MPYERFNFDTDFQDKILACIVAYPEKFMVYANVLSSAFFTGVQRIAAARAIFAFWRKHHAFPDWNSLGQVIFEAIYQTSDQKEEDSIMKYIRVLRETDTTNPDYVASRVVDFARERAIWCAFDQGYTCFQEGKVPEGGYTKLFDDALKVGLDQEIEDCATVEAPPIPPVLIEGLLHQGSKMALGGSSKSYKTWLLLDLGISVATGSDWWGRKTTQGRVLYANFELGSPFFHQRKEAVLNAKKLTLQPGQLDHWCLRGKVSAGHKMIEDIIIRACARGYVLVILDPIYKLLVGGSREKSDENSATDITRLLNNCERLAVETGAAVAFGAHFSKGNQAAKEAIDRISGSGVYARDPDAILTVTRHKEKVEEVYSVESKLRNFPPADPFCVRWVYPLFELALEYDPADLKQPERGRRELYSDSDLMKVLEEADEPLSYAAWRDAVLEESGMSEDTFKKRRRKLLASGKVAITNGKYFVLAKDDNESPDKGQVSGTSR